MPVCSVEDLGLPMKACTCKQFVAQLLSISIVSGPLLAVAQEPPPASFSFVLGTVYEVDKERYRDYIEALRRSSPNLDETALVLEAERFLDERDRVVVTARQLSTNRQYVSPMTGGSGEYTIKDAPAGTFDFTLRLEDVDYPVQQRLDVNVELSYVAELCFVIDREERVAWMITDGARRTDDVPAFVPRECVSALSACLAVLTGTDGRLPDGLLLFLAGGAAATLGIGISIDPTDEIVASPVVPPPR